MPQREAAKPPAPLLYKWEEEAAVAAGPTNILVVGACPFYQCDEAGAGSRPHVAGQPLAWCLHRAGCVCLEVRLGLCLSAWRVAHHS